RNHLMHSYFNQMSEGMQNMSPEQMQRMKDMLNELNQMLEQRERGEEPDFEGFMQRYGDFFPGNPQSLDELLEQMAQSMAQMQQLLNSMTPEQRAQLQALSESLLEDMDLRWQVDQLSRNLQNAFPNMPWQRSQNFSGNDPMSFGEMPGLLDTLGDLDALENVMRSATQPGELAEVDIERARELLGDDAARSLDRLRDVSLSMPMRVNFPPATKVAMALHALITSQFPRDYFGLVSFGRVARDVKPELLPEMSWDFEWGTNMQHALLLARKQLSRQTGTKQIIMVTDGEPTAHIEGGEAYFQYPPSPVTIEETLKEVMRCTRDRIRINTFMLDESYYLKSFVEQMMRVNGGRAFFTNDDTLGDYVLVDFLDHLRQQRRAS